MSHARWVRARRSARTAPPSARGAARGVAMRTALARGLRALSTRPGVPACVRAPKRPGAIMEWNGMEWNGTCAGALVSWSGNDGREGSGRHRHSTCTEGTLLGAHLHACVHAACILVPCVQRCTALTSCMALLDGAASSTMVRSPDMRNCSRVCGRYQHTSAAELCATSATARHKQACTAFVHAGWMRHTLCREC